MSQLVDDGWIDSMHNWAIREGQSMDWTRIKRNAELKAIEQRRREDAREAKYRQLLAAESQPDANCITLPDGDCVSEECMHTENVNELPPVKQAD